MNRETAISNSTKKSRTLAESYLSGILTERQEWSTLVGEGRDDLVTADEFADVWADVNQFHSDHMACPKWCDVCGQWELGVPCPECRGSGCSPLTALGAYAPCEHCAGDGREHETLDPLVRERPAGDA